MDQKLSGLARWIYCAAFHCPVATGRDPELIAILNVMTRRRSVLRRSEKAATKEW